jgi:diaminopimelate dehydrogenase
MKTAIVGYGNLGKALAKRQSISRDFELLGIFSRRKIESPFAPTFEMGELEKFRGKVDCLLLAGGSFSDLPKISPVLAKDFNIVDSFDTHAKIKNHFLRVDEAARRGKTAAIISCGWDPGLFSLFRFLGSAFLSDAKISSFWGRGVSQGHSEAIKRIDGVKYAIEYTVPKSEAINSAFKGVVCDAKSSHGRECYVVAEEGRDREIEEKIKNIPEYFLGYETRVNFISKKTFFKEHNKSFHGGRVISFGKTSDEEDSVATMELSVKMNSNPEFTAGIMLAYARAAKKLCELKIFGAKTPLDVPPSFLSEDELFNVI